MIITYENSFTHTHAHTHTNTHTFAGAYGDIADFLWLSFNATVNTLTNDY